MKLLSQPALLAVLALVPVSCSPAEPKAPPAAAVASTQAPTAPAHGAEAAAAQPTSAPAPAAKPAVNPAADPANARGKRAQGETDSKLDSKYDLSKLKAEANQPVETAVHSDEDGHDHSRPAAAQDGSSLLPAAQAQRNNGRIDLRDDATQVKDLGKMRQGESASHDFPFVSNGEGPLVITGVKPSCGCTKAVIVLEGDDGARRPYTHGDPIPVGQKFLLESEISTDGKPGGPFTAQISIYGNDQRGVYNTRLTAEIEPVLTITPSQTIFFGRMTTAETKEQEVTVAATRGEPFKLALGQEMVQGPIKLEYTPKNPDAEGRSSEWTVKVAMGPNSEIGMRSFPINMKSDIPIAHPKYPSKDGSPQYHSFMLNVQAQVTGMVSAEPSFLTFGMVKPGEPIERSLRLECHDDFKLTSALPVVFEGLQGQELPFKSALSATVEPLEEGKAATIKVRLEGLPADMNGSFGGVARLKVGHPFMEELQVRFSGVCRPNLPTQPQPAPVAGATETTKIAPITAPK